MSKWMKQNSENGHLVRWLLYKMSCLENSPADEMRNVGTTLVEYIICMERGHTSRSVIPRIGGQSRHVKVLGLYNTDSAGYSLGLRCIFETSRRLLSELMTKSFGSTPTLCSLRPGCPCFVRLGAIC